MELIFPNLRGEHIPNIGVATTQGPYMDAMGLETLPATWCLGASPPPLDPSVRHTSPARRDCAPGNAGFSQSGGWTPKKRRTGQFKNPKRKMQHLMIWTWKNSKFIPWRIEGIRFIQIQSQLVSWQIICVFDITKRSSTPPSKNAFKMASFNKIIQAPPQRSSSNSQKTLNAREMDLHAIFPLEIQ